MSRTIDISRYKITRHCKKRWKKRKLDYVPKNEKRKNDIREYIKNPMIVIKTYYEKGTYRVTDYRYEYVIDCKRKTIITMNAYKKSKPKRNIIEKSKKRFKKHYVNEMRRLINEQRFYY